MQQLLAIAGGGALGASLRYFIAQKVHQWLGVEFPYGILVVNILGCLLMGILAALLIERFDVSPIWRGAILIGFLGGFTTFSSFTIDTFRLYEQGQMLSAGLYVLLSVLLCLTATMFGIVIGRSI